MRLRSVAGGRNNVPQNLAGAALSCADRMSPVPYRVFQFNVFPLCGPGASASLFSLSWVPVKGTCSDEKSRGGLLSQCESYC